MTAAARLPDAGGPGRSGPRPEPGEKRILVGYVPHLIEASGLEGCYQPGKLGCRIEDILGLGENNEKVNLTHFPKDELIVLGK